MCSKSDSIVNIAKALVAFAADVKPIEKDGTNPHFKSQYTTLDHMIDETKPLLQKHGLTVMQFPGGDGERITVRTMILHTSGEWMESEPLTLKAVKTDPQGAGSAITYARRYSYAAALSLSLGDDDDGNAASHSPQEARTAPPKNRQSNTPPRTQNAPQSQQGGEQMASEAQGKYMWRLKNEKKLSDDQFRTLISDNASGKTSSKELTKKEASDIINLLNEMPVLEEEPLPF